MSLGKQIFKAPIKLYKAAISPFLAPSCRFYPSCSTYALEAIERHGVFKGGILGLWRIIRCNPWHKCDYHDPVPERFKIFRD